MSWLHTLWFGYFWTSTKGNGPENLLALAIGAAATRLCWPFIKRDSRLLHAKMDHIIKNHPDIPPFPGVESAQPIEETPNDHHCT